MAETGQHQQQWSIGRDELFSFLPEQAQESPSLEKICRSSSQLQSRRNAHHSPVRRHQTMSRPYKNAYLSDEFRLFAERIIEEERKKADDVLFNSKDKEKNDAGSLLLKFPANTTNRIFTKWSNYYNALIAEGISMHGNSDVATTIGNFLHPVVKADTDGNGQTRIPYFVPASVLRKLRQVLSVLSMKHAESLAEAWLNAQEERISNRMLFPTSTRCFLALRVWTLDARTDARFARLEMPVKFDWSEKAVEDLLAPAALLTALKNRLLEAGYKVVHTEKRQTSAKGTLPVRYEEGSGPDLGPLYLEFWLE